MGVADTRSASGELAARLAAEVAAVPWYHTLALPGGVVTRGRYDLRGLPARLPIPASLDGRRCLDVGSSTGFWAFELERRGASEVVSLDLDDGLEQDWQRPDLEEPERGATTGYARRSFELAHRALGSSVRRVDGSVYDVATAGLGSFDFVFVGSLLLHLRDPIGALSALRAVTAGRLLSLEPISPVLAVLRRRTPVAMLATFEDNHWWLPNPAAHRRYMVAAGFTPQEQGTRVRQPFGDGFSTPMAWPKSLEELVFLASTRQRGLPSSWILSS